MSGTKEIYLYQMPTRVAVPIFFVVSGYFLMNIKNNYFKKVTRFATRYLFWVFVTVVYEIFLSGFSDILDIIERYTSAVFTANEYLIGVMWFIIVFAIVIFALRHPFTKMNSIVGEYLGIVSSLLFFTQRILLDITRIKWSVIWGSLFKMGCTWGNMYIVTLLETCAIGLLILLINKNKRVKKICAWII